MGVSGSGKSTIGKLWADYCQIPFLDADDYHPEANIQKMSEAVPLTDADRWPWLERLAEVLNSHPKGCVLACSALKESYRDLLAVHPEVHFVYLNVTKKELLRRLNSRPGHFMPASLLDSQFAALETPKDALVVDADKSPGDIIKQMQHAYH